MCKQNSTKSRIYHGIRGKSEVNPPSHICRGGMHRYARRRRECRGIPPGILSQGDQRARSANKISNWLRTKSQLRHLACQCLRIRWEAKYNIRRRESSLVKDGLFFVICRNCRFKPSMIFVVYMILRISKGYSKKVLKISQFSSQLLTQEGYCFRQRSAKASRFFLASFRGVPVKKCVQHKRQYYIIQLHDRQHLPDTDEL